MKIAIMQPYFFPYLGYLQLVNLVDIFVFCDDVNFIKNGWIARNRIISKTYPFQYFRVKLNGASQNKLINEVKLINGPVKLLKTIRCTYSKAPYFNDVYPLIEKCLTSSATSIAEMSANSVVLVADYLGIETEFEFSSKKHANSKGIGMSERLISICKHDNASCYCNLTGGVKLYSKDFFKQFGIELKFIESKKVTYDQCNCHFVENLSIIDVLMFNSVETTKKLLNSFELK
ncbi:WbqC family protein [Ancylomarina sp. YFZ004]